MCQYVSIAYVVFGLNGTSDNSPTHCLAVGGRRMSFSDVAISLLLASIWYGGICKYIERKREERREKPVDIDIEYNRVGWGMRNGQVHI